jgi:hypothetical protein
MMVAEAPFRSGAIQREAGFEDRGRLNQEAKAIAVPESLHEISIFLSHNLKDEPSLCGLLALHCTERRT